MVTPLAPAVSSAHTPSPSASALPTGPTTNLKVAGPLAVAPDGLLYVVDQTRHEILVRLPDDQFRVVAGDGRGGFSGDGRMSNLLLKLDRLVP